MNLTKAQKMNNDGSHIVSNMRTKAAGRQDTVAMPLKAIADQEPISSITEEDRTAPCRNSERTHGNRGTRFRFTRSLQYLSSPHTSEGESSHARTSILAYILTTLPQKPLWLPKHYKHGSLLPRARRPGKRAPQPPNLLRARPERDATSRRSNLPPGRVGRPGPRAND